MSPLSESYIICGDFNLVLTPDMDYDNNYRNVTDPKAKEKLLEIIDDYSLVDICREHRAFSRRYTWRKPNPIKQSRLDFHRISEISNRGTEQIIRTRKWF